MKKPTWYQRPYCKDEGTFLPRDIFRRMLVAMTDPLYHCIVVKESGCAHVDGYLCDYNKCDMRLNRELEVHRIEISQNEIHCISDNTNKNKNS